MGNAIAGRSTMSSADLDRMSDWELTAQADRIDVCCRVSPAHKTKIIDALKERVAISWR